MLKHGCWLMTLAVALAAGCDGAAPYRAVVQEQIAAYEEVVQVLAGVSDGASMQAAAQKLADRGEAIEETVRKARRLGPPSQEVIARMRPETEKLIALRKEYDSQVGRIIDLPGGKEFLTRMNIPGLPGAAP